MTRTLTNKINENVTKQNKFTECSLCNRCCIYAVKRIGMDSGEIRSCPIFNDRYVITRSTIK